MLHEVERGTTIAELNGVKGRTTIVESKTTIIELDGVEDMMTYGRFNT
jgi:hypothetical protein